MSSASREARDLEQPPAETGTAIAARESDDDSQAVRERQKRWRALLAKRDGRAAGRAAARGVAAAEAQAVGTHGRQPSLRLKGARQQQRRMQEQDDKPEACELPEHGQQMKSMHARTEQGPGGGLCWRLARCLTAAGSLGLAALYFSPVHFDAALLPVYQKLISQSFDTRCPTPRAATVYTGKRPQPFRSFFIKHVLTGLCITAADVPAFYGQEKSGDKLVTLRQCQEVDQVFSYSYGGEDDGKFHLQSMLTGRCLHPPENVGHSDTVMGTTRRHTLVHNARCKAGRHRFVRMGGCAVGSSFVLKHAERSALCLRRDVEDEGQPEPLLRFEEGCHGNESEFVELAAQELPYRVSMELAANIGEVVPLPQGKNLLTLLHGSYVAREELAGRRKGEPICRKEAVTANSTRLEPPVALERTTSLARHSRSSCPCGSTEGCHLRCRLEDVQGHSSTCTLPLEEDHLSGEDATGFHLCPRHSRPEEPGRCSDSSKLPPATAAWLRIAGPGLRNSYAVTLGAGQAGEGPVEGAELTWSSASAQSMLKLSPTRACWSTGLHTKTAMGMLGQKEFAEAFRNQRLLFIGNSVIRQLSAALRALLLAKQFKDFHAGKVGTAHEPPDGRHFEAVARQKNVSIAYLWRPEPGELDEEFMTSDNSFAAYFRQSIDNFPNHTLDGGAPLTIIWGGYGGETGASEQYACASCRVRAMQERVILAARDICRERQCRFVLVTDPPVGAMHVGTHCDVSECLEEASSNNSKQCPASCLQAYQRRFWSSFVRVAKEVGAGSIEVVDLWETGRYHELEDHIHFGAEAYAMMLQQVAHRIRRGPPVVNWSVVDETYRHCM
eukprot:TRINITY_DN33655_c0_g1_i1.p1 TRINITY_DN33655_c0_g1~~TRINITY_DN33655_c0_g1_i1.p1  ORF type:complete len:839 (+),score=131.18 TRINITY_DN33655_c0_g1_i1:242-2758(+)